MYNTTYLHGPLSTTRYKSRVCVRTNDQLPITRGGIVQEATWRVLSALTAAIALITDRVCTSFTTWTHPTIPLWNALMSDALYFSFPPHEFGIQFVMK